MCRGWPLFPYAPDTCLTFCNSSSCNAVAAYELRYRCCIFLRVWRDAVLSSSMGLPCIFLLIGLPGILKPLLIAMYCVASCRDPQQPCQNAWIIGPLQQRHSPPGLRAAQLPGRARRSGQAPRPKQAPGRMQFRIQARPTRPNLACSWRMSGVHRWVLRHRRCLFWRLGRPAAQPSCP